MRHNPKTMAEMLATLPQTGTLTWIGLRPARLALSAIDIQANPATAM